MNDLIPLSIPKGIAKQGAEARRPPWLRVKVTDTQVYRDVGKLLDGLGLHTVCEEARCPNIWECWGTHKTATFMILGDVCTKTCRYCSVGKGKPGPPDPNEPARVAEAVARLELSHTVVTSVDRDDLEDLGSLHWVATIEAIRRQNPKTRLELLIPDFLGNEAALRRVMQAGPDILGHNVETVPRLYKRMRPKGSYDRALEVLQRAHQYRRQPNVLMTTKTGLMVGMGETVDEILDLMDELRQVSCDVFTIGQYLNPTKQHQPVVRFYTPDEFQELRQEGLRRGFLHVESGPLVRSSYHAHAQVPVRP